MIESIIKRAKNGGRQAIAAPRGRGKSELTKGLLVYLVLAGYVRFPLAVAATTELAKSLYTDFKKKLANNHLLYEDFPEVCHPIRALEGAPQRAGKQHIDGVLTEIVWTDDYISLPKVAGSPYGGVKMNYYGLDAAFRGANIDADRPDFIIIDDPETRESARSPKQIDDRKAILQQDIEGLTSQEDNLAIVVLTTVQNTFSLSFQLTEKTLMPSYNGRRFGMVLEWPTNGDLWQEYIRLRKTAQIDGDEQGVLAVDHYIANFEAMNEGVKMLSDYFVPIEQDGRQLVLSAIQQAYNKIADTNEDAYRTEYQNDPPKQTGPQGSGISKEIVASRLSGLSRRICPANTRYLSVGVDVGKYQLHWTVCAWWEGAGGCVVDYGTEKVYGTSQGDGDIATEKEVFEALVRLRDRLNAYEYKDTTDTLRRLQCGYIDSGAYTNAIYAFVKQCGGIWHAIKGLPNYRQRTRNQRGLRVGKHQHEQDMPAVGISLTELDADYWKQFVHERFLTPCFDENNMLRRGSLSLFSLAEGLNHLDYAEQLTNEELLTEFKEGEQPKEYWYCSGPNHWFDSTAYAAACTERADIALLTPSEVQLAATPKEQAKPRQKPTQHGQRFKQRPGGWVAGLRNRGRR